MYLENIFFVLKSIQIKDFFDIFLTSLFLSLVFYIFWQTRSYRLLEGIIILIFIYLLSDWLNLNIINSILKEIFNILPIALVIIFYREIKFFLSKIRFLFNKVSKENFLRSKRIVDEIINFLQKSKELKIGSILVFEKNIPLEQNIKQKIEINSNINGDLLLSIFNKTSPLHDGAVIIKEDKIKYVSAILPVAEETSTTFRKGTRHRAALGITEENDSFAIVISEENGNISLAEKGRIKFNVDINEARKILEKYYYKNITKVFSNYFNFSFNLRFLFIFFAMIIFATSYWVGVNYTKVKIQKIIEASVEFKNLNENFILENIEPTKFKVALSGYKDYFKNFDENNIKIIIDLKNFETGKYTLEIDDKNVENIPKNIEILTIEPSKLKFFINEKFTTTGENK